jgi:prophage regulatory protein
MTTNTTDAVVRILRREQVSDRVGLSPSQVYALVAQGKFPRPVPLSRQRVGWVESEVAHWLAQRIAERDRPRPFQVGGRRQRKASTAEAAQ